MSTIVSKLFRLRFSWLTSMALIALSGCSLLWNAESIDTPPTERMRCDNALDDDEDGLADCLDEDCAWDSACLTVHRPFEILPCGFLEKQKTEAFNASSLTNLENRCRDVEASSSFGGNRSVCGPPKIGLEPGEGLGVSAEYELNHWNVFAESYCANPFGRALFERTCGRRNEAIARSCDAPVLACTNASCRSFGLFLNGDRTDGQPSGVINRESDLWLENTDFFEIDTSIRRLHGPDVSNPLDFSRSVIGDNWDMYPCNSEECSGTCKMEMKFEPKQTDAPGPRLTVSMVVEDEEALSIRYAVTAGLGDELFARDERSLSGECGTVALTGDGFARGYPLRISGPYYMHDDEGRLLPSAIISRQSMQGEWEGLCAVPWDDNVGITPETEYQVRFTRQGVFNRGKLLLLGVNIKQRKRVTGSRALCGPSDVAIFQGGRTVCGYATDTVDRVWSVARYFDDEARRLVIARVDAQAQYKAFEEVEGVLFELIDDDSLPSFEHEILSLESVAAPESTQSFRLWTRSPDGALSSRVLRLQGSGLGMNSSFISLSGDAELTQVAGGRALLNQFAQSPGTVFRTQTGQPGYTWVSLTDAEIVIAHSTNGVDDWQEQSRSADFYEWLSARTELADQVIVDVVGLEVPSMQLNSGTQRMLLLLTTHNPATQVRTSHVLTLVRDMTQSRITYLFYHAEVAVEPVTLSAQIDNEMRNCGGDDCPQAIESGVIAMTLDNDKHLMIYGSTTIDDSLRPQRSLKPLSECVHDDLKMMPLPESRVWRRLMYRLK